MVSTDEITFIRALILQHPEWGRVELSLQLCREWDWRRADGTWNHGVYRDLLLRLHEQGRITLPPPQRVPGRPQPVPAEIGNPVKSMSTACPSKLKAD